MTIWDWLISVPLAVAGLVISIYYGRLGLRTKKNRVSWRWESVPMLHASSAELSEHVKVEIGGRQVDAPHLVRLFLRNAGTGDLPSSCFDKNRPLNFRLSKRPLWSQQSRAEVRLEGSEIKIGPLLLRSGEWLSLSVLCDGDPRLILVDSPLIDTNVVEDRGEDSSGRLPRERGFRVVAAMAALLATGYVAVVAVSAFIHPDIVRVSLFPNQSAVVAADGVRQSSIALSWRSYSSDGERVDGSHCSVHVELRSSSNSIVRSADYDQCSEDSPLMWPVRSGVYTGLVTVQGGDHSVSDTSSFPIGGG